MQRSLPRSAGPASPSEEVNPLGVLEATLSFLWIITPLSATVSLLVVGVSMVTNQWLHTTEKMSNPSYNGTGERDYLSKFTISGLWMLCFTNPGETMYQCSNIDYFSREVYSPDPTDSTLAIPYTVKKTVLFFLMSSLLLSIAYLFCVLGQCLRHRTLYTFVSGVMFIVTGLVMLFGLIMYISIFKSEIGSKLRPRSQLHPPVFDYAYGYSFLLYVSGVISAKLTGVSSVFLFIYRVQYEWRRKQLEEFKRGERQQPPMNNYNHQVDPTMFYPCRRHPQAYVNSNSAVHFPPSPAGPKRFYFRKEPFQESPCSVHRARSQSNSLKDVSNFYDFPPPPTISYQFAEHFNKNELRSFPITRDVTSNTVSTTADLACEEFMNEGGFEEYSPGIQHEHEFVTFNLDQPLPLRAPSMVSIASRNGAGQNYGTLRRTTPV